MTVPESEPWSSFLTERDRKVFAASGYGARGRLGSRPVVLVVDVNVDFVGDRPRPVLESIQRFPNSCGEEAWDAMANLSPLLDAARTAGVPVVYTTNDPAHPFLEQVAWGRKSSRLGRRRAEHGRRLSEIPYPVSPVGDDVVVVKTRPSAFFGTPLLQYLVAWGTDTVLCCGATTSGCVRATVVDAFSHGFAVQVVTDCTFDRGQASHALSLFDMGQKYADLVSSHQLVAQLRALAGRG
ncbi:MAG: isochorismatase family protein [Acidimicrobiales bacterium]